MMASMYFGLIGLLILGMHFAQEDLNDRPQMRPHQAPVAAKVGHEVKAARTGRQTAAPI
jgi:hypothetical protein